MTSANTIQRERNAPDHWKNLLAAASDIANEHSLGSFVSYTGAQAVLTMIHDEDLSTHQLDLNRRYAERPFLCQLLQVLSNPVKRQAVVDETASLLKEPGDYKQSVRIDRKGLRIGDLRSQQFLSGAFQFRDEIASLVDPGHRLLADGLAVTTIARKQRSTDGYLAADATLDRFGINNMSDTSTAVCRSLFGGSRKLMIANLSELASRRRSFTSIDKRYVHDILPHAEDLATQISARTVMQAATVGTAALSRIDRLSDLSTQQYSTGEAVAVCPAIYEPKLLVMGLPMLAAAIGQTPGYKAA